jgi:hypothetical protein
MRLLVIADGDVIFDRDVEKLEIRDGVRDPLIEPPTVTRGFELDATYESEYPLAPVPAVIP